MGRAEPVDRAEPPEAAVEDLRAVTAIQAIMASREIRAHRDPGNSSGLPQVFNSFRYQETVGLYGPNQKFQPGHG